MRRRAARGDERGAHAHRARRLLLQAVQRLQQRLERPGRERRGGVVALVALEGVEPGLLIHALRLVAEQHGVAGEVRIAFDGDAVLFSDEAEQVFQSGGLDAFQAHERDKALKPLPAGPFKPLLEALQLLQRQASPAMRVRTALVTARSAPAHERAIRTLMDWNIEVDEAMFLGGLSKGEFLREFEPDFFFDDQTGHVHSAAAHVPSGHVASGISNV